MRGQTVKYRRFDTAAEAIRCAVEELPAPVLPGITMEVDDDTFEVSLIPETLERTTFGSAAPGRTVNLEVDVFAKYVEKLTRAHAAEPRASARQLEA